MRPSLHHADVIIGSLPLPSLDGWRGRAVALALGLVSATGFQPLNLWPLTLAVIALFMMMAHAAQSRWGALALGWWFGLGHFTLGLNWIATSFTYQEIGRAHVCTPVTNAHLVCRLLLEKQ